MGYPCVPRRPPPSLSLYKQASEFIAGRLPIYCSGLPHPARASCRQATHTLLPASPTPPAPSALLPRPQRGAGSVRGDIRGAAVSGAMPGVQPCPGLLRDLPMCWTVEISPRGEAARGAGELVPPPLSPTLQPPYFSPAGYPSSSRPPLPRPRGSERYP